MGEQQRIDELVNLLNDYSYSYYVLSESKISDYEYDKLYRELKELEEKTGIVHEDSPTVSVGFTMDNAFEKVPLNPPMLSLDNVFEMVELADFIVKTEDDEGMYCFEHKLDGLSCELRYKYGKLYLATTRGNGETGENVTHNALKIKDIPKFSKKLENIEDFRCRGEVYMLKEVFERVNKLREKRGEKLLANPRNTASGTMRNLDSSVLDERELNMFVYDIVDAEKYGIETQKQLLIFLDEAGFKVQKDYKVTSDFNDMQKFIDDMICNRNSMEYDVDGAVIKLNNLKSRRKLGEGSKAPKWATAYKFPPEQGRTRIVDVEFRVGRTGVLTPRFKFEPLRLAGSTVTYATGNNQDFINDLDLRIGDIAIVQKAGDIIPEIIGVDKTVRTGNEKEIVIPDVCPECGGEVIHVSGESAKRCVNNLCPAQAIRGISYFVSKDCMDIDGMGEKLVEKLYNGGFIKNYANIYELQPEQFMEVEGMGLQSIANTVNAIEDSKGRSLERLITGLGIPLVGKRTAKDLAKHFKHIGNLMSASVIDLVQIEGIGYETATSIYKFFGREDVLDMVETFSNCGINLSYIGKYETNEGTDFNGKSVVITGGFTKFKRTELTERLEALGASVKTSVSTKTDILVCGEDPGSKLTKAEGFGTRIIHEEELLKILNI